MIRAQYYSRQTDNGLLIWDVRRLVELTSDFPAEQVRLADIAELDESDWYGAEGDSPTCRSLLQHMQLIDGVDTSYPIILDQYGRVMDGMHRVCRALRDGNDRIAAVRFEIDPKPDFVDRDLDELLCDN